MDDLDRKYRLGDNAPVRIDDDLAEDLIELTERVKARRRATVDKEIAAYKSGLKEANIYGAGSNEPAEDPDFADLAHRIDTEVLRKQLEETKRTLAEEAAASYRDKAYTWKSYALEEKEKAMAAEREKARHQEQMDAMVGSVMGQAADGMNRLLYSGHRPSPLQGLAAPTGGVPPQTLMLALAYYLTNEPKVFFAPGQWASEPMSIAYEWLRDNGLVDGNEATEKLSVWLKEVLATPLPVQRWEVER